MCVKIVGGGRGVSLLCVTDEGELEGGKFKPSDFSHERKKAKKTDKSH